MKQKVYRPDPVRVDAFFFEHLPATRDADAGFQHATQTGADGVAPYSPSPSPSSPQAPAWSLAKETGDEAVDRILWSIYTPEAYRDFLNRTIDHEDARTHTLEKELEEKWTQVESLLALNAQRHDALTASAELLSDVHQMRFWTAEDIVTRFNIDVTVGANTGAAAEGEASSVADAEMPAEYNTVSQKAHITLDYSVMPRTHDRDDATAAHASSSPPPDSSSPASSGAPGLHHAKAWTMDDEALLDYTRRPHHLRRLFAPLLQRRAELPKALTLLLNEVQAVQSQRLPQMETQVESEVMFTVPIYLPLQIIAMFMTRYLTRASENEEMETAQVAAARALSQRIDAFQYRLIATAPDEASVMAMSAAEREHIAGEMWRQLFDELEAHRRYHEESLRACAEMESRSKDTITEMRTALQSCATASACAMSALEADAKQCTAALTKTGTQALAIVDSIDTMYHKDAEKLSKSIQAKKFALDKSAETQEKLMRRVREAVKEAYHEQFRYQELTQEWLQEKLALTHLTCSYEQIRAAMKTRHEEAVNARQHAENVHALLREAEEVRQTLLTACEQHIGRLETEEFYRTCHVANQTVSNVQQWSRAVGDLAHMYEERYAAVAGRLTGATWQMEYLMAGERDWAVGNLLDVRKELVTVDARWKEAMALAEKLDLFAEDAQPLLSELNKTDTTVIAREAMRRLDDSKQVQRKVETLNTFRTRTLNERLGDPDGEKHLQAFAAGSGASAALRLTNTASADAGYHRTPAEMKAPSVNPRATV